MKTQSNIPIPNAQLWKEGQWMLSTNQIDNGYLPTGNPLTDKSAQRYEADFTIVDAQTPNAAIYAFTRMTQDVGHDNKVIHNIEVDGQPAILVKPVYLNVVAPTIFAPLPAVGTALETGHIYSYNNMAVMVRQPHNRTIYPPEQTPALFSFYREDNGTLIWIENEQVGLNAIRYHLTLKYKCLQPHQTVTGQTPNLTPALWEYIYVAPPATKPPQWASANWANYVLNYEVFDSGKVWKVKGLTHTWIQPAMTGNGAISWTFVKDWI